MQLKVPFNRTISFIDTIPNGQIKESVIQKYWKRHHNVANGNNGEYGEMRAQAVCWLYCWVMTKGGVYARNAFDNIFKIPFGRYPKNSEFHEWARKIREKSPSIYYETRLSQELGLNETEKGLTISK